MRFSYLNLICLVLLINQCCFAQTPKFEETLIPLHSFSLHSPYIGIYYSNCYVFILFLVFLKNRTMDDIDDKTIF